MLLAAFAIIEARAEAPLLPLRLFRLKTLAGSNAVGFLLGASFYGYIFIGTLFMQQVLGYSAMKTGLAWLVVGLTGVALAGPAQMLVTRASVTLVMAVGMTLTGSGILWATQIPAHGSFWAHLAGPFFLTGAVTWVFIPVSIGALIGVTERDAGVASGLIDSSQQLGGAIGIAVASTVAAVHSHVLLGQVHASAEVLAGGFHWALWVCGLVGLAAVPAAFLLVRRRHTELADMTTEDPFRLQRFVAAQDAGGTYVRATAELRGGRKTSHWMWFVFPQIAGLGYSPTSRTYAITSLAEARAYLAHPVLGARLTECATILLGTEGRTAEQIFGDIDARKLHSCVTLFMRAAPGRPVFRLVLDRYFGGVPDSATDERI
ncbi:MAG TPA: MFS transporter [Streptosporangiaceae bacterium]